MSEDELEKELQAAIAVMPESTRQALQGIDIPQWMETMAWMSEDWLEIDKLLEELGYPTQFPETGNLHPMADRFRDFCVNTGLDIKEFLRHQRELVTKDEEE